MAEKLHLDDASLRELLHLVSHDIRNPLAAIVTNLEFSRRLVKDEAIDPDLRESVEDSVIACEVLKRVVANFDVLAKGDDLAVTMSEVGVAALVQDVARRCRERASQASLHIDVDDGGVSDRVFIDKPLFALAVENLISNSIQHAPRGTPIEVRIERGDSSIVVSVIDAGKAVPPELREYALSAESHTPKGRSGPTRYGRGLSLLAARAAAGACGATLSLHGEDGRSEMRLTVDTIAQEPTLVS
ncbi:MAG: HAMP domain-containing sensor histidine kinase [Polyangiaceae bacterium]